MIDAEIYARLMGALAGRIGKPLTEDTSALYYAILSEELTTEQFQAGMTAIFRDHAYATWPPPAAIIARARPSVAIEGNDAWAALEGVLKRRVTERPLIPQLRACGVDEMAIATFLSIGGLSRWRSLNDFRFDEMRREFLAQYGDLARLPAPEREAYTTHKIGSSNDTARVRNPARDGGPALLRDVSPYSPGDAA